MSDLIRSARRAGALAALLVPALIATGCAKKTALARADSGYGEYPGMVSALDYGYVRPATDVRVIGQGSGGDLWARVRAGMRLDLKANPRIDGKVQTFRRDPLYLAKLSQRARPYLHVIVGEIERRGFPAELALLPHVESRYNPGATSPKAAAGIWQFMPYTGREMGLHQDSSYDGRRDLVASTRAAMDYLQMLNRRFGGDWELAMAAYNCGPGRVESAQAANRRRGMPTDFWSLDLPNETENYVPQILAAARLVSEPRTYGLNLPPVPDRPQVELVRTDRPVELARVAQASGVQLSELKRLNPALKRGQTAPYGPGLLVPAGTGRKVSAGLASARVVPASPSAATFVASAAPPKPARPMMTEGSIHMVRAGETLGSVASAKGVDIQSLADFNGMAPRDPLLPGQSLRIPTESGSGLVTHRVRKGDSLSEIARRYGVTVSELRRWNRTAENGLRTGAIIRIYRKGAEAAT